MSDIPLSVVEHLLATADSVWQFELFCARHFSVVEKTFYVITSKNYDNGRDGRSEFPTLTRGSCNILASLCKKADVEKKAHDDLKKLLRRDPRPARVRFCFTADITEPRRDRIVDNARKQSTYPEYEVTGQTQLLDSIGRFPQTFEKEYENEFEQFRRMMRRNLDGRDPSIGLRVALGTQLSGTAERLRMHVLCGLVLRSLPSVGAVSPQELCVRVSNALSLDPPVNAAYLATATTSLAESDFISITSLGIERRRKADEAIDAENQRAALNAIDGYTALRDGVSRSLEEAVSAPIMKKVWGVVSKGIIRLFHQRGLDVARSVHSLSQDLPSHAGNSVSDDLVQEVAAIGSDIGQIDDSDDVDSIYQRISASFAGVILEPESLARRWFSELSLVYVTACSLSLHPDAVKQVEQRIRSWRVIPDTHFVLSLLGCSEPDHSALGDLTKAWIDLGGEFLAVPPVVSEAYHHVLKGIDSLERWKVHYRRRIRTAARGGSALTLPDRNVFLRSAQATYGENITPANVEAFMTQFGTKQDGDARRIRAILEESFRFAVTDRIEAQPKLQDAFFKAIFRSRQDRNEDDELGTKERCETDARLLVYLSELRRDQSSKAKVTMILSNSGHMKRVCDAFPAAFKAGAPIVNVARIAFALSLQPGTAMSVKSLESMFFGGDFSKLVALQRSRATAVLREFGSRDDRGIHTTSLRDQLDQRVLGQ